MNIPNLVTLSRIPLMFLIAGFLYIPVTGMATVAFVLFIVAAWSDWLDGYLARCYGLVSDFGILMDALTDKILMVGMLIALLALSILPGWALFAVLLILSREFVITGLRLVAASKGKVLAAERGGKWKTVFQMTAVIVLLLWWAIVKDFGVDPGSGFATFLEWAGLVVFVVATVQTVLSGAQYLAKYWTMFTTGES